MGETQQPRTEAELCEAITTAVADASPLEIIGGGSKRQLGRPLSTALALEMAAFSGISLYEPEELVLTAGAATPLSEIEAHIAERGQRLAFEPPDYGPLLGQAAGGATIGGVLACNLSGPRRVHAGAARDHFLGVRGVNGRAEAFKSGGRVVKNVTGYDLCKLLAGSYGTLAAVTEVTVRTQPRTERDSTLLVLGLEAERAVAALARGLRSPFEVSGAAWLPDSLAAASGVRGVAGAGVSVTALRIEGYGPSADERRRSLREALSSFGATAELQGGDSRSLWRDVRDVAPFVGDTDQHLWRASVPPSEGPRVIAEIARAVRAQAFLDRGGGLVWIAVPSRADATHEEVRAAVTGAGGHALLVRAPSGVRAEVPVFPPLDRVQAGVSARIKEGFDPSAILNPGRMYEGV